ncbi:MAG: bifunctional hydroxymethylpyrimidine kinase/phosphomethylpyrimidine kinase [Aestuariivirga sp.]
MALKVLSISSQVAYGNVGNSAAVPAMQALGHEVLAVPTIFLSTHPGLGQPASLRVPAPDLAAILGALDDRGILASCNAVMTGYFAANDQIHGVARIIRRLKEKNPSLYILVDPIIGDDDALYVPLPVAEAIRDRLLPLATCLTPNCFELSWLVGRGVGNLEEATAAARSLGVGEILATSIPAGPGRLATLVITGEDCFEYTLALKKDVPHGTGDFLAGLYLAERLAHGPQEALRRSMLIVERAIKQSPGSAVLNIAAALQAERNA